jgi:hypothetical protein
MELIDKVIERESIPKDGESYADLGFVKYYVKELSGECKDCAKSQNGTPVGAKKD